MFAERESISLNTEGTQRTQHLGPVVRSVVSLIKKLVKDSFNLIVLTKSIAVIFFAEKL